MSLLELAAVLALIAEKTIEGDKPKSPSIHTNESTASENTSVNSSIAFNPEPTRQLVKPLKILDLSLNYDQPPVQPNIVYPYKSISKSKRSFNSTWYKQHSLSPSQHCNPNAGNLTIHGYSDWKHIGSMAKVHDKCDTHKLALAKYKGWCNSKIQGSVTTMIDSQIRVEVAKNRTMLKSLIRCAIYCARQDIGLRGHSETTEISEIVNNDIATENKGNFVELVKLLCIESQTCCSAYEALPKNAKYTSKIIQNDMISAASTVIAQSILKEVQEGSKIFSLIVDEARDDAKLEQMSICIRYVHNSVVKERFLGFVELKELNANALSCNIKLFLNNFGLDLSNCVSQSYDGASVMSGQFNGVQKKIKDMSGNLCPYIHCHAHKLNLVLVDVSRKVEEVHDTIGLLEAVYAFQSSSTLRYQVFFDKTGSKVPMHCDTRWVSKFKSIRYFKNNFTLVLTALKECTESSKSKEAAEAKVNILSLNLQTTTLDYSRCAKLIKSTMEQLINLRSEKIFINIYNEAVSVFQTSNIEPNDTLRPTRELRISSTLDNYLTYSTLGASTSRKEKQNMSSKDTENEFKRVFFQILDNMNNEMIYRFTQNNEILNYIHASDPKSSEFLNSDLLVKLGNMYQPYTTNDFIEVLKNQCLIGKSLFLDNLTLSDLHQQISNYGETFDHVKKIIELVMAIPVSSASAERSFSTMRRVKTYLRSTMKSSRLSSLTLLSIDFENSDKLLKDPTAVLEVFASMKNRRIQFQI
ncbi:zinc finger MYM-type protein 1-like [Myzus persicae]|uniref:zinc finger MYM-type protein 1-like n=1 Tax=Myzus persicae TaxID=13164 RepID=UPI000B933DFB|nr:zinc finger MYM-type protein 1-like [Myzus persicae]